MAIRIQNFKNITKMSKEQNTENKDLNATFGNTMLGEVILWKLLKRGYCNVMLAYYVDYKDENNEKQRCYFDYIHEANTFVRINFA